MTTPKMCKDCGDLETECVCDDGLRRRFELPPKIDLRSVGEVARGVARSAFGVELPEGDEVLLWTSATPFDSVAVRVVGGLDQIEVRVRYPREVLRRASLVTRRTAPERVTDDELELIDRIGARAALVMLEGSSLAVRDEARRAISLLPRLTAELRALRVQDEAQSLAALEADDAERAREAEGLRKELAITRHGTHANNEATRVVEDGLRAELAAARTEIDRLKGAVEHANFVGKQLCETVEREPVTRLEEKFKKALDGVAEVLGAPAGLSVEALPAFAKGRLGEPDPKLGSTEDRSSVTPGFEATASKALALLLDASARIVVGVEKLAARGSPEAFEPTPEEVAGCASLALFAGRPVREAVAHLALRVGQLERELLAEQGRRKGAEFERDAAVENARSLAHANPGLFASARLREWARAVESACAGTLAERAIEALGLAADSLAALEASESK